jgi:serine/threonine protein kinase
MASLDHPHIVRLIALYEDDDDFRIVTELMNGGELFDQIVSRSSYGEREACEVVRTLAQAIAYLHSRGIVHRGQY